MKKRTIKNLDLNKKSISDLSKEPVKGGAEPVCTLIAACWSQMHCPTIVCNF